MNIIRFRIMSNINCDYLALGFIRGFLLKAGATTYF